MNDNERLNEILEAGPGTPLPSKKESQGFHFNMPTDPPAPPGNRQDLDLCQWQVGPNGIFRPAARTVATLPPGAYSVQSDNNGAFLASQILLSDDIVRLPESANILVLDGIRKFWNSRARYTTHGLVFKRGVLLWGPPGSGKTVTVHLLTQDLIAKGGIVVFCGQPELTAYLISAIRRIENKRPLIIVYEDIDEIIAQHGEHTILALLDGEQQTDNVVSVATTNYPDRLGARIVNRPSRFDDRIFVGMPSENARLTYLAKAVGDAKTVSGASVDVALWARETKGLSVAHLRELVAAVLCLDQEYAEVLSRLRSMNERPKAIDGYAVRSPGFLLPGAAA